MKLLALIVSVVLATALLIGGSILIAVTGEGERSAISWIAFASLPVFIYGPLVLGSLSAYWNPTASSESRKAFRIWLVSIVGVQVLAGIGIVLYAVRQPAPAWLPPLLIGAGILLTAIALVVGRLIYRHDKRQRPDAEPWAPIGGEDVRRKVLIIAATFCTSVLVAAALVIVLLAVVDDGGSDDVLDFALLGLSLAFLATATACIFVTLKWNRRLRDILGDDLGAARKHAKLVLRGTGEQLSGDAEQGAARYAAIARPVLAFQLGWIVLLYIGIGLQQVQLLRTVGSDSPMPLWVLVILVGVLVVTIPLMLVRIRRARRYARDREHLLRD